VIEPTGYIICIIGGITFMLIFPRINRWGLKNRLKKIYSEGRNDAILGPQRIQVQPEHLICASKSSISTIEWSSIERIAEDGKYLFLYISTADAIIIPYNVFETDAMRNEFINTVELYSNPI
jgi:hypothetical protein